MSENDIRTKRVYDKPAITDGNRVLIDRLWPRGVSRASAALDLWLGDIAPTPDLRMWFGHDPDKFATFTERYEEELAANPDAVERLLSLGRTGTLTLLYAAHDRLHNNAVVLASYLQRRHPGPVRSAGQETPPVVREGAVHEG